LDEYLKEAYFTFNRVVDQPVAILLGLTEVSFGQDFPGTLDFQNDASHAMTDPDNGQIKGITVVVDQIIRPFDKFSVTLFSPNPDIKIASLNHIDGFATRVSKTFFKVFETQASYLRKGNAYDPALRFEQKFSVAGVFKMDSWTAYAELISMDHAAAYPDANAGMTTGIHRLAGPGQLNVEFTAIANTLDQEVFAYQLFLSRGWTLASALRQTNCRGGNDGCVAARGYGAGLSAHLSIQFAFGSSEDENATSTLATL
jgi:hypothetical protein